MPLQATSGAASYDAFGGGVAAVPNYIEECFSTTLYTGNGSTQTITNGIDLAGKGGLVWGKTRTVEDGHFLFDTARGVCNAIFSNATSEQINAGIGVTAFNSNGFTVSSSWLNASSLPYASWTFRKQPKFFDVVTWTGNDSTNRQISHSLGSTPGCIIVKNLSDATYWCVYHTSLGATKVLYLNYTGGADTSPSVWNNTEPTSTNFTVGNAGNVNGGGNQYVAYLYASNAGGFGLTGTDNVISCGSFTTNGSGAYSVTLGYEPQWVMYKRSDSTGDWLMFDNMRGIPVGGNDAILRANTSGEETQTFDAINPTATGFYESTGSLGANRTFIYIAIRRGPMKVPTSGTSVYNGITRTGTTGAVTVTGVGFTPDMGVGFGRSEGIGTAWYDRLRGKELALRSALTNAEYSSAPGGEGTMTTTMDGMIVERTYGILNSTSVPYINWFFKRAPSFFDEVCWTGDGTLNPRNHNLAVTPELVIVKRRSSDNGWYVSQYLSSPSYGQLNTTAAFTSQGSSYPVTSTTFVPVANTSGQTFVAYLFATCAGVSKCGTFTGTGTTQQVDCGFTGGARFVLIKRTDSTGDWYVWDSARGIVSGNDPYLLLNSTAAEVTITDYIDTYSAGFELSTTAAATVNVLNGTYIYLAIA